MGIETARALLSDVSTLRCFNATYSLFGSEKGGGSRSGCHPWTLVSGSRITRSFAAAKAAIALPAWPRFDDSKVLAVPEGCPETVDK